MLASIFLNGLTIAVHVLPRGGPCCSKDYSMCIPMEISPYENVSAYDLRSLEAQNRMEKGDRNDS